MIKFLSIFLFSLNASANLFGRGMLMTKAVPPITANVTCWWDVYPSGTSVCADGTYSTSSITDNFAGVFSIKKKYYCPNKTNFGSFTTNELVWEGTGQWSVVTTTSPTFTGISHFYLAEWGVRMQYSTLRLRWIDTSLNTTYVSDTCTEIP